MKNYRFRSRLILAFLFFACVPLIIVFIYNYRNTMQVTNEVVSDELDYIAELQKYEISSTVTEIRQELKNVGNRTSMKSALKDSLLKDHPSEESAFLVADSYLNDQKNYGTCCASVSLVNREFEVVGSTEPFALYQISDLSRADANYYKGKFYIGNLYQRTVNGEEKNLFLATLGIYENNKLLGYMVEEVDADKLISEMDDFQTPKNGAIYVYDENNLPIYQVESNKVAAVQITGDADFTDQWEAIDWAAEGEGNFNISLNGTDYICYYDTVPNTAWHICIVQGMVNYSSFMKAYWKHGVETMIVYIIVLVVLAVFMGYELGAPLSKVVSTLKEVRETQDYSLRIKMNRKDEFGELAKSINNLLAFSATVHENEREVQQTLRQEARLDPLTHTYNKRAILEYLTRIVLQSQAHHQPVAVGFVDIDDFRQFNTEYGHLVGDEVLTFVSSCLKHNFDLVGRNGGDEFLVAESEVVTREGIVRRLESFQKDLAEGVDVNGVHVVITCSIGVLLTSQDSLEAEDIIKACDEIMYQVKKQGKNGYRIEMR